MNKASLYFSLLSFFTITLAVLIASPKKASSDSVWRSFTNSSGWQSDAIAWFTGLLGVNWGFSCLDSCTHMAEEIPHPERNIPKAILGTVAIGFITSWIYSIALFFSMQDIDAVIGTVTYVPSLELFRQALKGSVAGAVALQALVIVTAIGCLMSVHTWQCRLVFIPSPSLLLDTSRIIMVWSDVVVLKG
jgi:choline transport protein